MHICHPYIKFIGTIKYAPFFYLGGYFGIGKVIVDNGQKWSFKSETSTQEQKSL